MTGQAEANEQTELDEYSLKSDELTKEQFADKAGVSVRNVEIWKKDGKLPAQKLRRRIDGVVRTTTIFKLADVDEFLNKKNEATQFPVVERNNMLAKTSENDFSQQFVFETLNKFADSMNNLASNITPPQLPPVAEKPFLNVKEAAEFSGLSESCIRQLVKTEQLTKFTGKNGETVISRKQLLSL